MPANVQVAVVPTAPTSSTSVDGCKYGVIKTPVDMTMSANESPSMRRWYKAAVRVLLPLPLLLLFFLGHHSLPLRIMYAMQLEPTIDKNEKVACPISMTICCRSVMYPLLALLLVMVSYFVVLLLVFNPSVAMRELFVLFW